MENIDIDILTDCVRQLELIKQRIENVNDENNGSLNNATYCINEAIQHIENAE